MHIIMVKRKYNEILNPLHSKNNIYFPFLYNKESDNCSELADLFDNISINQKKVKLDNQLIIYNGGPNSFYETLFKKK